MSQGGTAKTAARKRLHKIGAITLDLEHVVAVVERGPAGMQGAGGLIMFVSGAPNTFDMNNNGPEDLAEIRAFMAAWHEYRDA